jgi:uncharacterized protein
VYSVYNSRSVGYLKTAKLIVGICEIELYLPEVSSLKGKRSVLKSLLARMRNQFNVSAAEVGLNDVWQSARIGVATVSNSSRHANQSLQNVIQWIEANYPQVHIVDQTIEIL